MAATTIITSSNGWKTRPLVESDYDFFMEAFSDYPLGTKSYRIRQNKFSGCIYNNSLYNDSIIFTEVNFEFSITTSPFFYIFVYKYIQI